MTGSNITIWEPNSDAHTAQAKTEMFQLFGVDTLDPAWNTNRIDYDGTIAEIDRDTPILLSDNNATDTPGYFKTVPSSQIVTTAKSTGTPRADTVPTGIMLEAGITKFRIYMWLEGQDWDCRR